MLSREATNTNLIVFGLTRQGLEPTIYCTRGEHGNHYTTDAVSSLILLYPLKKLFEYNICHYEEMLNSPLNFFFIAILIFDWLAINLKGVVTNCSLDSPLTAVASILVVCHSTSLNTSISPLSGSFNFVLPRWVAFCHVGVTLRTCTLDN